MGPLGKDPKLMVKKRGDQGPEMKGFSHLLGFMVRFKGQKPTGNKGTRR